MNKRSDKCSSHFYSCFNQKWEDQHRYNHFSPAPWINCAERLHVTRMHGLSAHTNIHIVFVRISFFFFFFAHESVNWHLTIFILSAAKDLMELNKSHITFIKCHVSSEVIVCPQLSDLSLAFPSCLLCPFQVLTYTRLYFNGFVSIWRCKGCCNWALG